MHAVVAFLGCLCLSLYPLSAKAEDPALSSPGARTFDASRTLNGHAFLPLFIVPWPFVSTWIGSRTGVGVYDLPVEPLRIASAAVHGDARLVAFSQSFDANLALTRWLGVSFSLSASNAVGVNDSGVFNLGLNYAYGGDAAAIFRLLRRKNWQLALRFQATTLRVAGIVPARLAASARLDDDGLRFDPRSITSAGHHVRGRLSLVLAESHTRYLGLQASVGMDVTRTAANEDIERSGNVHTGLGASVRFNELQVPLAWSLGASLRTRIDGADDALVSSVQPRGRVTGQIETGLFYSEPQYVDVGVQYSLELGETELRSQARFVINHFW